MIRLSLRAGALACLFALSTSLLAIDTTGDAKPPRIESTWVSKSTLGAFAHRVVDGQIVCSEAGIEQARQIKERQSLVTVIAPDSTSAFEKPGLNIVLRGTQYLQSHPDAREALKRAAAQWEAVIQTPVMLVVDVDFGPMLFDKEFADDVVATTDVQVIRGNSLYPAVRASLISGPYSPERSLPYPAVATDQGESIGMSAPSAALRALELIDSVVRPDSESSDFGPPPAIGLNSKFEFDFEAADGIEPDKLDFEAIVLHELGHILGFITCVRQQEGDTSAEVESSISDLFRLRPDVIESEFSTAQRILSPGGEHSFNAGPVRLALSTGGPDGTGGDGRQAAHWKDNSLTGQYLGVMDPTIRVGEHQFLTDNDISLLKATGYRTKSILDPTLVVPLVSGRPQPGGMIAPPPNLGLLSRIQYSIAIPPGAGQLRIDLVGNQDVDLFVRFGDRVLLRGHDPVTDHQSTSGSGSETITVTPSVSPPLRAGIYYLAVVNFGPGDAEFTITATVFGGRTTHAPSIFEITPNLEGDVLLLGCAAIDRDGDLSAAEVSIFDEQGRLVGTSSTFDIALGDSTNAEFQLSLDGLSTTPTARRASIVIVDRSGNRSAEAPVDFGKAQPNALSLLGGDYSGSKLKLKIRGLSSGLELEVNGQVVAPRRIKANQSGGKLTIKGDLARLNLKPGANRIRLKNINGWSNILVLNI